MKLRRLRITNFRSFGRAPADIDLEPGVTAFVGNNGSGKTTILAALLRLYGVGSGQRTMRRSDFHVPVGVAGPCDGCTMAIDCTFAFADFGAGGEDPSVPEVFSQMSLAKDGTELQVRMRLQATWTDDGTQDGLIEEDLRWIPTDGDDYVWEECRRVPPAERSLVQLIYVPASRNASEQITSLLKSRLWSAACWSDQLKTAVGEGGRAIQESFDQEQPASFIIDRLAKRWSQVHHADSKTKPRLRVADAHLEDLMRRVEFVFSPDASGRDRRIEDLSDGQRSLFHIALTAATLEVERDAHAHAPADAPFLQERLRRTYLTILAIEEPENSLSPFFLSRIMLLARDISEWGSAQVLISSHSAGILSRIEPREVRYVRLRDGSRRTRVRRLSLPDDDVEASNYVRLAVRAYPELYFARFVILAEGESEAVVIPRLAEAMGLPLDRSFVPIVPLGGRFVHHFWRLLDGLRIPYATLLDLDAGRKHGGSSSIAYVLRERRLAGRGLSRPHRIRLGLKHIARVDDEELVGDDQNHPWLKFLRTKRVYFSSPIDLDFAMLALFPVAYQVPRPGGRGPRMGRNAILEKKASTLKTGGDPGIYDDGWDGTFAWYPYLFAAQSKPATHLAALGRISDRELRRRAPIELRRLLRLVQRKLGL